MKKEDFIQKVTKILNKTKVRPAEAYDFLGAAVCFAAEEIKAKKGEKRHITARELLEHIGIFASKQFGVFARDVLEQWKLVRPPDIGSAVFLMVETGLLSANEGDSIEDFNMTLDIFPPQKPASPKRHNKKVPTII